MYIIYDLKRAVCIKWLKQMLQQIQEKNGQGKGGNSQDVCKFLEDIFCKVEQRNGTVIKGGKKSQENITYNKKYYRMYIYKQE